MNKIISELKPYPITTIKTRCIACEFEKRNNHSKAMPILKLRMHVAQCYNFQTFSTISKKEFLKEIDFALESGTIPPVLERLTVS